MATEGLSIIRVLSVCAAVIALSVLAVSVFRVPADTILLAGVLLACPLLHALMMKGGGHRHDEL